MSTSIGNTARNLIATMQGASNQQILDKVLEVHQGAKTTLACIAWYKSDMKKNNVKIARTEEVVAKLLEDAKMQVEALEEELQMLQESNKDAKLAMYKKLQEELGLTS